VESSVNKLLCLVVLAGCPSGGGVRAGNGNGNGNGVGDGTAVAADAAILPADAGLPEKVVQLNRTGEIVDLAAALVPGYVTIVDFWADWCGACEVMEEKFMAVIGDEPRVLVRKIDVGDGDTPVAEHYDIGPLPHLRIYDTRGELRYVLLNNEALEAGEKALEVLREAE
jgi:thiol-disulfide isomerase/thioredoxin